MLFNSIPFLIFFPIVVIFYFVIPYKGRCLWLLITSYFFYMCWNPRYILLIMTSTIITFVSGQLIEEGRWKQLWVFLSFASNLSILFFFKYMDFFVVNFNAVTAKLGLPLTICSCGDFLLPVGISFYTFQALGYTVDVYRGNVVAERNLVKYALFVAFFPQLVAGPIERTSNLLPQFDEIHTFEYDRVVSGLRLMLVGFLKKIVIADLLAVLVDGIYGDIYSFSGPALWLATLAFSFQIYCDFSGYSDIARGAARVMGFRLMENFNAPYLARSMKEFWDRWHISLSTWFRDYIYIPLGGNRRGFVRKCINLIIVFTLSGLWHGASWHFVAWGMLHGIFRVTEELAERYAFPLQFKQPWQNNVWDVIKMAVTFLLVNLAWVFFRAEGGWQAIEVIKRLALALTHRADWSQFANEIKWLLGNATLSSDPLNLIYFLLVSIALLLLVVTDYCRVSKRSYSDYSEIFGAIPTAARWCCYCVLSAVVIWVFVMQGGFKALSGTFIYFQF